MNPFQDSREGCWYVSVRPNMGTTSLHGICMLTVVVLLLLLLLLPAHSGVLIEHLPTNKILLIYFKGLT